MINTKLLARYHDLLQYKGAWTMHAHELSDVAYGLAQDEAAPGRREQLLKLAEMASDFALALSNAH